MITPQEREKDYQPHTYKVFGAYHDRIDDLVDGDEVGRLLTLRAAREYGVYRLYTRKSAVKAVFNKQIRPVVNEGMKSFYLKDAVMGMRIRPDKGRKSPSSEEIRAHIAEMRAQQQPSYKIDRAERLLATALEAEAILGER